MLGKHKDVRLPEPTAVRKREEPAPDAGAASSSSSSSSTSSSSSSSFEASLVAEAFGKCLLQFDERARAEAAFEKLKSAPRLDKLGRPTKKVNLGGAEHCFITKTF